MSDEDARIVTERRGLVRHTACFTGIENALLMTRVELAGVSISAFLKACSLDHPMPRAARRPTLDHALAAALLGQLGDTASAFRAAAMLADERAVEAALTDLAEYRLLVLRSLGRKP